MPLYEYECGACSAHFELIRKFSDPPVEHCTVCGKGPVRRLLSSPAIQFKGSGWYITDYAQKGKSGTGGSADKSGDRKGDAGKAEGGAKGDTKSDTASKPAASSTPTSGSQD
jgi:putative FmdB family regulatory protein